MADPDAWAAIEAVYRADFARFARFARAVTGDRESALEAVQEGFADALRKADRWRGGGTLEAWIWSCVLNRARKARPHPAPAARADLPARRETDPDLRARLAALPERQRLVVFLRYFADLGYAEIAATLGIEVGTVSATLHAAHTALRRQLEEVTA
ncbi:MAG: RNA polymerase sigma factor [Gaiellaceae bacterium]